MAYNVITAFKANLANAVGNWLRTVTLNLVESATVEGFRFGHQFDRVFASGETKHYLYINPVGSDITMALQERRYKTNDGASEMEILWNVEAYTPGTLETTFNQRNSEGVSVVEISEIATPTEGAGVIVRESDFIPALGQGSKTSGDIASGTGFRMYEPGTYFIFKVTNLENKNNRISVSYDWVEVPAGITPV